MLLDPIKLEYQLHDSTASAVHIVLLLPLDIPAQLQPDLPLVYNEEGDGYRVLPANQVVHFPGD